MGYREEMKLFKDALKEARSYTSHEDVNDIFWGTKYVDGKPTNEQAIRFNVHTKKQKAKLKSSNLLPKKINNFKTDVTDFKAKNHTRLINPLTLNRPLIGGQQIQSSLFNSPLDWGTLGCSLRINGIMYGITNFHVAFGEISEDFPSSNGLNMVQPKARSFGTPIGNLTNVYNRILDYSLFELNTISDAMQSINGFNGIIEGFVNPFDGMRMFKFGASSRKTFGIYDSRSLVDTHRIVIRYDGNAPNDSNKVSLPGDSGSMWVSHQGASEGNVRMVALNYGGDVDNNVAFATLFSSISQSIRTKLPLS